MDDYTCPVVTVAELDPDSVMYRRSGDSLLGYDYHPRQKAAAAATNSWLYAES